MSAILASGHPRHDGYHMQALSAPPPCIADRYHFSCNQCNRSFQHGDESILQEKQRVEGKPVGQALIPHESAQIPAI